MAVVKIKKVMVFGLACFTGLLLLASCSAAQSNKLVTEEMPLLHFQKTPCLGVCPSYEAIIYANGRIRYIGYEHVPVVDTAYFELPDQVLADIKQDIASLQYTKLPDTYLTNWSDMPSTITTFYEAGKEVKRIKQQEGGPQSLLALQEKVHTLLMNFAEEEARKRLPVK